MMKRMVLGLMIVLMSMMASTPSSAKTGNDVKKMVPTNIVVKQTTKFSDGRTLTIYYKKQGMNCEIYSPCNAGNYNMNDASKIKSTNFEVVDKVEGKLYKKASVGEVTRLIKRLVNKYL